MMHRTIESRKQEIVRRQLSRYVLVEILEKSLILIFFGYLCFKLVPNIDHDRMINLVLLLSEGLTAALVLFHRPSKKLSRNPNDWIIALSISFLPTFISPMTEDSFVPASITLTLMVAGFLLQLVSKLYIFRSFGIVPANRGIRVNGPYAIVRHPIYAGYLLTSLGFILAHPHWLNITVYSIIAVLQIRRIFAEEFILSQDPGYQDYMTRVRYRLLPGVF